MQDRRSLVFVNSLSSIHSHKNTNSILYSDVNAETVAYVNIIYFVFVVHDL